MPAPDAAAVAPPRPALAAPPVPARDGARATAPSDADAPGCSAVASAAAAVARRTVVLAGETDLDGFRAAARRLLAGGVAPQAVEWRVAGAAEGDLYAGAPVAESGVGTVGVDGEDDVGATGHPAPPDGRHGPAAAAARPAGEGTVPAAAPATRRPAQPGDTHGLAAAGDPPAGEGAAADEAAAPAAAAPGGHALPCAGDALPRGAGAGGLPAADAPAAVRVPAFFVALCAEVVLHRDPGRFGLLYRLLWRLAREPALRADPIDPDRMEAERMARAVRREVHKMKAFVRFRTVGAGAEEDAALHVAWFEPAHHVVEAAAPWFARRLAGRRWAILTPDRSLRCDGGALHPGPGARRAEAPPADAGEALWLTYYESIFNPARLKFAAMRREMPLRYWPALPEAVLIAPLAAAAHERSARMIERPAAAPRRRIPVGDAGSPAGDDAAPGARHTAAMAASAADPAAPPSGRAAALASLRNAAARCRECPLWQGATQTVFGEGPLDAPLMLVGEQPGDQEDLRGRPFVGPAGRLLDRALAELGWPRERLYASNAVKHFKFEPRGTRRIHKSPAQKEADACLHWLEDEIALVRPRAIVALGATAARQLLGRPVAVLRERGRWHQRADGRRVLVALHPSALLRTPPESRDAAIAQWLADLRVASAVIDEAAGAG